MRIDSLLLRGFRNYEEAEISFDPGVNLILGDNAQGKTNLLEGIFYLSCGRSFRTRKEAEIIGFGQDFAELEGKIFSYGREKTLRAVLFAGRRPRQLFLSGVKQKGFGAMAGEMNTVLFCPEDLMILKAGASSRRRLMDDALCQLRPKYEQYLTEYGRVLEHKSRILKDWHEDRSLLELLPDFNLRLCRLGTEIIHARAGYLEYLGRFAADFHREFSGKKEDLQCIYKTVSSVLDPKGDKKEIFESFSQHMHNHWRAELESGQCLSGPHKDDFEVLLGGVSLKSFGSQGQTRTAAISLKLSQREIFRQDTGEEPVLLLDDVLSELDAGRQDFVLNHLKSGQVFITCCEKDRLTDIGKEIFIEKGSVKPSP